ncbi:MAG: metallophosphoesterase family protein [Gaiellales bacterium]
MIAVVFAAAVAIGVVVAAYAWFEAGWLRTRVLEVVVPRLPAELDGLRIGHLSDFHLGAPLSRGSAASERAAAWVASRAPDLVCITGDLVSHPRGEPRLRRILALLERPVVVLGNHDVAITRDPFSRKAELDDLAGAVLLRDSAVTLQVRGTSIRLAGSDPEKHGKRTTAPWTLADSRAALNILICHYPSLVKRVPPTMFQLALAGHLHAGQICVPLGRRRRVTLAHPRAERVAGLYPSPAGALHISPGTGTTLVPFRLFARPEVTELVLRRGE